MQGHEIQAPVRRAATLCTQASQSGFSAKGPPLRYVSQESGSNVSSKVWSKEHPLNHRIGTTTPDPATIRVLSPHDKPTGIDRTCTSVQSYVQWPGRYAPHMRQRDTSAMYPTSHWFFFSAAMNPFGGSPWRGDLMLATADTPISTMGMSTKNPISSDMMSPGVRSWYRARMPPVGGERALVEV